MNNDSQETRKELGDALRKAREKAQLTQAEVATAAGINVNYYSQIERGEINPSFEKLKAIKKALKVKSLGLL